MWRRLLRNVAGTGLYITIYNTRHIPHYLWAWTRSYYALECKRCVSHHLGRFSQTKGYLRWFDLYYVITNILDFKANIPHGCTRWLSQKLQSRKQTQLRTFKKNLHTAVKFVEVFWHMLCMRVNNLRCSLGCRYPRSESCCISREFFAVRYREGSWALGNDWSTMTLVISLIRLSFFHRDQL